MHSRGTALPQSFSLTRQFVVIGLNCDFCLAVTLPACDSKLDILVLSYTDAVLVDALIKSLQKLLVAPLYKKS
jgi:hypothetical protein